MVMPDGSSGPKWTAVFEQVVARLAESDRAVPSRMFGMPCGNINGKAFAGLYQDDMVFKLGGDAQAKGAFAGRCSPLRPVRHGAGDEGVGGGAQQTLGHLA
jgi:hypothetical protein